MRIDRNAVSAAKRRAIDFVFPRRCALCGEVLLLFREGELCPDCLALYERRAAKRCPVCRRSAAECACSRLRTQNLGAGVAAIGFYETSGDEIGRLIYSFKRRYSRDLTRFFARSLAIAAAKKYGRDVSSAIVTFPPRSAFAVKKYGFDHAKYLARESARYLGAEFAETLVRRGGTEQKKLDAAGRSENVSGVFAPIPGVASRLGGESDPSAKRLVILVDDVATTGATLSEAARVLRDALSAEVRFAVLFLAAERDKGDGGELWFEEADGDLPDESDPLSDDVGF